jgi:hypothetical protein
MTNSVKRFCTACQLDKPVDGGEWKVGKIKRWVCKICTARMSMSPYRRGEED